MLCVVDVSMGLESNEIVDSKQSKTVKAMKQTKKDYINKNI